MGKALVVRRGIGADLCRWEKRTVAQVPNMVTQQYINTADLVSVPNFYVVYDNNQYVSWTDGVDPVTIRSTSWSTLNAEAANRGLHPFVSYNSHWYQSYEITASGVGPIIRFNGYLELRSRTVQSGTKDGPGDFISDVYASDADRYPANGVQNGYWYIKQQ